jgi:hypothetical protein
LLSRGVVSVEGFTASQRPLARIVPDLRIGPMLAAPLIAHDRLLGVLTVVRGEGAAAFSPREAQRLAVIADHAALAMWKAELLEQSRAADRAKGRFLATISHELRTPLTALTGYEELLADEVMGPLTEPQTDVVERMRSVTHHLTVMIEEVLAFSSIEAGREIVRATDFLVADLIRAAMAIVEPLARQKRLRLTCDLPSDPIRLTSDIDKVRQILVNLLGNAVKFTDRGEVRIALREVHSSGEVEGAERRASPRKMRAGCSGPSRRSTPGSRVAMAEPGSGSISRSAWPNYLPDGSTCTPSSDLARPLLWSCPRTECPAPAGEAWRAGSSERRRLNFRSLRPTIT